MSASPLLRLVEPADDSDERLMARVTRDDRGAFEVLVERHLAAVHRFCARLTTADAADDLTQETFSRLWRARARWAPSAAFTQYLFSLALNVCRNHQRGGLRRLRALTRLSSEPLSSSSRTPEVERLEAWQHVQQALAQLPQAQREAIVARYTGELDSEELGEALGCNASTARSRVFFGLKRLKELLGGEP